jgi:hypothetical protein
MILSRRERVVIAVTVLSVAALVLDRYVLEPVLEARDAAELKKQGLLDSMEQARSLLNRQRELGPAWKEMSASLKQDPAEAESQVLHAVRDWSKEAGLKLVSVKPERTNDKKSLQEIAFLANGTGTMKAVTLFLVRAEAAKIPMRVTELQLGTRKDGADDFTLHVRLSTLYQSAQVAQVGKAAAPAAPVTSTTGGSK